MTISTTARAKAAFHKAYKGNRNFMTPYLIRYGIAGSYYYELSKGKSMTGGPLYGVTVITVNGERRHDLSEAFHRLGDAEAHIASLRNPDHEVTS